MAKHSQHRCSECDKNTLHVQDDYDVDDIFHLLLTACSLGLWLPGWLVCVFQREDQPIRCTLCGQDAEEKQPAP